jgi:uncharacterized protein YkwD
VPKLRLVLAVLAVALGSLRALAPAAAATPTEQARILELTNQARAANGLPPVSANGALNASAETYSLLMATANFFSHTGPDGSTLTSRNESAGYGGWTWMGENIAAGQATADDVFQAWMNSPGHRANILSAQAREIGIGHAFGPTSTYKNYWTMELGARPGAPAPAAPTATPAPAAPTATPVPPAPTATAAPPTPTVAARPVGAAGAYRVQLPAVVH